MITQINKYQYLMFQKFKKIKDLVLQFKVLEILIFHKVCKIGILKYI